MFKPKLDDIQTLDKAKAMLTILARDCEKYYLRMLKTQAQFYQFKYANEPEPSQAELKSRIIYLEQELSKVIKQRDDLRTKLSGKERSNGH